MRLTDAQIRCLLALLSLTRLGGEIASKDVSTVLGVSRPSVHRMLENLGNSGLTEKKPYGAVKLTKEGLKLAEALEVSVSELLGAKIEAGNTANPIADQLARINGQLAVKNRRARRIWKIVALILASLLIINLLIAVVFSYLPNLDDSSQSNHSSEEMILE